MPYQHRPDIERLELGTPMWRYMDFSKFVAMLSTKALYLSRIDKLGDDFEGCFPQMPPRGFRGFLGPEWTRRYPELLKEAEQTRRHYFASCWHGNDHESDAMWKVYLKGNDGVAIRTTFRHLQDAVKDSADPLWIGKVKYLPKFVWDGLPDDPFLIACMTKRQPFAHEQETRVILHHNEDASSSDPDESGRRIPCDLETLIQSVYVSPSSKRWFKDVVEDVLHQYGVSAEVERSSLAFAPTWECKDDLSIDDSVHEAPC